VFIVQKELNSYFSDKIPSGDLEKWWQHVKFGVFTSFIVI
jgi:hypothetical protein